MSNPQFAYEPFQLGVTVDPLGANTGIDSEVETLIKLAAVIYLSDPIDSYEEKYSFIPLTSDVQAITLDQPLSFNILYSNVLIQTIEKYRIKKTFYALITLDAEGNVGACSNNFGD